MTGSLASVHPELIPEWSERNLPLTPDMLISAVHHEEGEEKLHLLMVDDHIPAGAKLY